MKIHALFFDTLSQITSKHAEEISRGIERGHDHEFEAELALRFLSDIQKKIRDLERIESEFDVNDRINVPEDLKWMRVSAVALSEIVAKRSSADEDIIRGFIFHDALFRKIDEVREWAKEFRKA